MDGLVVVISQAIIARRITITAFRKADCFLNNLLEHTAIICNEAANMSRATGNRIVQNNFIYHATLEVNLYFHLQSGQKVKPYTLCVYGLNLSELELYTHNNQDGHLNDCLRSMV